MRYTLKRDDIPLLSQWIKKFDKLKLVEFFGMSGLNECRKIENTKYLTKKFLIYR